MGIQDPKAVRLRINHLKLNHHGTVKDNPIPSENFPNFTRWMFRNVAAEHLVAESTICGKAWPFRSKGNMEISFPEMILFFEVFQALNKICVGQTFGHFCILVIFLSIHFSQVSWVPIKRISVAHILTGMKTFDEHIAILEV